MQKQSKAIFKIRLALISFLMRNLQQSFAEQHKKFN